MFQNAKKAKAKSQPLLCIRVKKCDQAYRYATVAQGPIGILLPIQAVFSQQKSTSLKMPVEEIAIMTEHSHWREHISELAAKGCERRELLVSLGLDHANRIGALYAQRQ